VGWNGHVMGYSDARHSRALAFWIASMGTERRQLRISASVLLATALQPV